MKLVVIEYKKEKAESKAEEREEKKNCLIKKKLIDYCDYRIEEQEKKKQGGLFCVYVSECLSECLSVCCERKAENTKLDGGRGEEEKKLVLS